MKKGLFILVIALSLCLGGSMLALAQDAEYYTTGDTAAGDLPLASVRSVLIDNEGGMWVGTNGGGLAYKPAGSAVFTEYSLLSEELQLGSDVVQALAIDANGGIWISQAKSYVDAAQNKGVAYYYNGEITYYDESTPGTIPNNYVQEIEIDPQGRVWFGSFGGLTCYDPASGEWVTYTTEDGLPAPSVNSIAFDSRGGVWYGCYPDGAGTQNDPFFGGFGYISADGYNHSWQIFADYDETYSTSLLADVWVRDIAVDANNGAWIVCSGSYGNMENKGGIIFYADSTMKNAVGITGKELLAGQLSGNSEVRCVEVDDSGTVWFGTWNGIYAFNWYGGEERSFSAADGSWAAPESMHSMLDNIYSLDIIGDTMYIGSNGGVCVRTIEVGAAADKSQGVYLNVSGNDINGLAFVNGNVHLLEVAPEVVNIAGAGVTFVPVRFVTENLGLTNNWSAERPDIVQLTGEGIVIEMQLGSTTVTVNGVERQLLAAPYIRNDRTMVPLRFISEILGYSVNYDPVSLDISIK